MIEKLTVKDVKVEREGHQAKKIILENGYTIEQYARKIFMNKDTLKRYCRKDKINNTLKEAIQKDFKCVIDNTLVIQNKILHIKDNILNHTNQEDFETIDMLIKYCDIYKLDVKYKIIILSTMAEYKFLTRQSSEAIKLLREVINLSKKENIINLYIQDVTKLAKFLYDVNELESAIFELKEIKYIINKYGHEYAKESSSYYNRYGVLIQKNNGSLAKEYYRNAIKYNEDNIRPYLNIAILYIKIKDYIKALGFLYKAKQKAKSNTLLLKINNNIADTYILMGNFLMANDYINCAIDYCKNNDIGINDFIAVYITYVELLKKQNKDIRIAFNYILEKLKKTYKISANRKEIVKYINVLIDLVKDDNDRNLGLLNVIEQLIDKEIDIKEKERLQSCAYKLMKIKYKGVI